MRCFGRCEIGLATLSAACLVMSAVAFLQGQEVRTGRVEVAVGAGHGVLLKSDGTVLTWGSNNFGELGRNGDSRTPAPVPGLSGILSVAADDYFSMALNADGSVWTWGSNEHGQLGSGAKNENSSPVPTIVRGLPRIVAIAAGGKAAMALDLNGAVWAWGRGLESGPQQVQKLPKIVALAAGDQPFAAIDASGQVWVWGHHGIEEINGGTSSDPQPVPGFSDIVAVAGGLDCIFGVKKDGTVWAAGSRFWSSFSSGSVTIRKPSVVTGLSGVKAIAAFGTSVYALQGDGTVWTWRRKPMRVGTLTGIAAIAAGLDSAAVNSQGEVWTWRPFGDEAPKIVRITGVPIPPEKTAAQKECIFAPAEDQQRELFGCEAANRSGKWIQICGDPDPDDPDKWKNINYRFGAEHGVPDFVFPAHPESAPPSLFYSREKRRNGEEDFEVIRFSTGAYTYRLYFGLTTGYVNGQPSPHLAVEGGVDVYDRNGKRLSHIVCGGAQIGADLSRSLPPDPKKSADRR